MAVYIVGLIVGGLTTVFPLIYLMNYDRCIAHILAHQPDFNVADFSTKITPLVPNIITSVSVIGAVVLLVSTMMIALTGLRKLRRYQFSSEKLSSEATSSAPQNKIPKRKKSDTEEETEM